MAPRACRTRDFRAVGMGCQKIRGVMMASHQGPSNSISPCREQTGRNLR